WPRDAAVSNHWTGALSLWLGTLAPLPGRWPGGDHAHPKSATLPGTAELRRAIAEGGAHSPFTSRLLREFLYLITVAAPASGCFHWRDFMVRGVRRPLLRVY